MYKSDGPGDQLLKSNTSKKKLVQKQHLKNRKRADWARLANSLLCIADAVAKNNEAEYGKKTGCPILVIGNPTFNAVKGQRATSTKGLIKYLARFFIVFVIDEYNTSKACNECHQHVEKAAGKGTRIWKCGNKECCKEGKKMNKDVSAWYVFVLLSTPYPSATQFEYAADICRVCPDREEIDRFQAGYRGREIVWCNEKHQAKGAVWIPCGDRD